MIGSIKYPLAQLVSAALDADTSWLMVCPAMSAVAKPYNSSAPEFQLSTVRLNVVLVTASLVDCTIDAEQQLALLLRRRLVKS